MNNTPLVSILMPNFNASRHIGKAIESVLAQTYPNWELLVVDDASTDSSRSVIQHYADSDTRIKPVFLQINGRVAHARNTALEQAAGTFVALLDSDDLWAPQKLEQQVGFMLKTQCRISYSDYLRIDEDGQPLGLVAPPDRVDFKAMLGGNQIGNLTAMYDAEHFGKRPYLNAGYEEYFGHEDYLVWLDILRRHDLALKVPAQHPLASYRVNRKSISSNKVSAAGRQWKVYRRQLKLPLLQSISLMLVYVWRAMRKRMGLRPPSPAPSFGRPAPTRT